MKHKENEEQQNSLILVSDLYVVFCSQMRDTSTNHISSPKIEVVCARCKPRAILNAILNLNCSWKPVKFESKYKVRDR